MGGEADLAEAARIGYEARWRHRVLTDGQLALLEAGAVYARAARAYGRMCVSIPVLVARTGRPPPASRTADRRRSAGSRRRASAAGYSQ